MISKVNQQDTSNSGDCLSACIASVLRLPIESVPKFNLISDTSTDFWDAVKNFFNSQGYSLKLENYRHIKNSPEFRSNIFIVAGASISGSSHAVVYKNGKVYHDPHPDSKGCFMPDRVLVLTKIEATESDTESEDKDEDSEEA